MQLPQQIEEIDRNVPYTLKQVRNMRLIPWANNYPTIRRLIAFDKERGDMLKVRKTGEGVRARYEIDGANIINYVKKYGPGAMLMIRKKKTWQPKQKKK